jgi:choline dehydrogenase-like flavoprotein
MTVRRGVSELAPELDIVVIGAGPSGLAVAITLEKLGLDVTVLEAGGLRPRASGMAIDAVPEGRHAEPEIAICEGLGGTSWWWGGRCVPPDPMDFREWPIPETELAQWYEAAAEFLGCGPARFEAEGPEGFSALERWARVREMGLVWRAHLERSERIAVCLEARVTALNMNGNLAEINVSGRILRAGTVVVATGGLASVALLAGLDGVSPALGKYYAGHVFGSVADVVLDDPDFAEVADFFLDGGTWVRRRFALPQNSHVDERILNVVFWVDNAAFHDWRHGSAILSAVYLALSVSAVGRLLVSEAIRRRHVGAGGNAGRHVRNVLRDPVGLCRDAARIVRQRYVERPRRPGFLIRNGAGRYRLTFHGAQATRADNRVSVEDGRLKVAYDFSRDEAASIVRAHEVLDERLRTAGLGRLEWHAEPEERVETVLAQLGDGFHQQGVTRMGDDAADAVVDGGCRLFGHERIFVAGPGVLPTSGQANPTFAGCALAIRLAHHIAGIHAAA